MHIRKKNNEKKDFLFKRTDIKTMLMDLAWYVGLSLLPTNVT